jgi:hypothetical protein
MKREERKITVRYLRTERFANKNVDIKPMSDDCIGYLCDRK